MAYPAVISLKNTIRRLLNSSRMSFVFPIRELLQSAYQGVKSLQDVLQKGEKVSKKRRESERVKGLEGDMREAAFKFEDALESHAARHPLLFSVKLEELSHVIDCFSETAKEMAKKYTKSLQDEDEEDDDDEAGVSLPTNFGGNMVGFTDIFSKIRDALIERRTLQIDVSIHGMAGIGKTTLAMKIYEDPQVLETFGCRVFVQLKQRSKEKNILQAILAQLDPDDSAKTLMEDDENILFENFWRILEGRNCLIVLDGVWDVTALDRFRNRLDVRYSEHRILWTSRLQRRHRYGDPIFDIRFLSKEESWDLLRGKVFVETMCPPQLEKAGKKIAENCEGLPLLIVTVADLLSKVEKTPEHWNMVAADKQNSVFGEAYEQISEVLYPSYNYLDQDLKACFLYLAVFPQNYLVRPSRIINLWDAEEFLDLFRYDYRTCLLELVSNNVVVVHRNFKHFAIKGYSFHSVFWYLSKKEARINKFLHILNRHADDLAESIESQRRLSIYKNVLLGIKDVYKSVQCAPNARSLLCTGAYHRYQVPICFGFLRMLKVLDVLTIRFYEFPMEVPKLVQLRYLALTCNGILPPSISKLFNLQFLIVHQHLSIKKLTLAESYLPVEVWYLRKLKNLEIMGRNLPDPPRCVVLSNLFELLDVGPHSCTMGVLQSIPKLKKLRVRIELTSAADAEPLTCFHHFSHLSELDSLQCVVVNPTLSSKLFIPPPYISCLKKLTLCGFGYPWKDMNTIAKLPNLWVLKLQCYAFRGEKWEVEENSFKYLEYLSIEDTDFVQWIAQDKTFPYLAYLTIQNCYKLQEIPIMRSLRQIYLVDCNPSAVAWANQMVSNNCNVRVDSSWEN